MTPKELLALIFGTIYVWVIYSFVSISGAYLTRNKSVDALNLMFWMFAFRTLGAIIMLCFVARHDFINNNLNLINLNRETLVITLIPFLSIVGWYCYFRLVQFGEMSIISPIISIYVLIPIIIAMIIRKKKFTLFKNIAIALCVISSVLLSIESNSSNSIKDNIGIQIACFIGIFVAWGFIDTRSAVHNHSTLSNSGIIICTIIGYFMVMCLLSVLLRFINKPYKFDVEWIPFWIANIIHPSAWLVFINVNTIDVSISLPLYSLNFMLPAIWGLAFLHDTVNPFKIISLLLSIIAIIILIVASYYQLKKDTLNAYSKLTNTEIILEPIPEIIPTNNNNENNTSISIV